MAREVLGKKRDYSVSYVVALSSRSLHTFSLVVGETVERTNQLTNVRQGVTGMQCGRWSRSTSWGPANVWKVAQDGPLSLSFQSSSQGQADGGLSPAFPRLSLR
jgi:hypothetical protein